MTLAWAASPRLLMRVTLLGMFNAIMPPISVYLSARLVNVIAQAHEHATTFQSILPIILGFQSLKVARENPEVRGQAHAIVGIVLGFLEMLTFLVEVGFIIVVLATK